MPNLPDCECLRGAPISELAAAIYCALYSSLSAPVSLPDCQCVKGLPLSDILWHTYCALRQFTSQPFTGTIEPSQIEGITPFGQSVLLAEPMDGVLLGVAAGGISPVEYTEVAANVSPELTIAVSQLADATPFGQQVLLLVPGASPSVVTFNGTQAALVDGFTGTTTPVNEIVTESGVVTSAA